MPRELYIACSCAALLLGLGGCDSSFDPRGPYTEKVAVYSILSTSSDTQYVRVYTSYNPSGFNPLENTADNALRNAQVKITQNGVLTQFRDTIITRYDKSRYTTDIPAYVAYPFRAEQGKTYQLSVDVPSRGKMTGTLTVPEKGSLFLTNSYVLKNPNAYDENLLLVIRITRPTRGYLVLFYLEYDLFENGIWLPRRMEVPRTVIVRGQEEEFIYPQLVRRTTTPSPIRPEEQENVVFSRVAYRTIVAQLYSQYASSRVRLRSALFVLKQVELNLYNYYNIVNGFRDEFSIRTDLPDYTSIQGGLGVFGAMTEDSIVVDIPQN
ncbi:MAG: DUF4249 family protein [Ignavibacteriales bacterium]|nr:DUF4249 family protein [Ignavibacteriales bacterium]